MDEIAAEIDEEVVMQIGTVPYRPRHASFFAYCSYQESLRLFEKASLVVGHCGSGTVLNARRFQVPIIVLPRRHHYGEHVDDHQVELAHKMERIPGIHVVYEIDDLENEVRKIFTVIRKPLKQGSLSERKKLIEAIRIFVKNVPAGEK